MGSKHGEPERWGSRLGVILAVAGSAVGLGNFLRFPGQAAQHGGGAFLIPYFCALLLLGIPIGWAEWTMGRFGGLRGFHSTPGILGAVGNSPRARYLGVLGLLIPLVVCMYYAYVESWCLRYAWEYVTGGMDLGPDPQAYTAHSKQLFDGFVGADQDGFMTSTGLHSSVIVWGLVFALNGWVVYRGLSRGIEWLCRITMPTMALCAVIVLVRVLTLGTPDPSHPERNVLAGLGFMWNPDFSKLLEFETWLAASGQIFFSLAVGFGIIFNYASYLRKRDDVVLSGLTAAATNELFEVGFGGMITVTAAFVFLGASGMVGGTFDIGFQTLPVVFAHMGVAGRFVGAVWFFMLFLAAITSSLSMLQPVKAFLQEALGLSRNHAVAVLLSMTAIGSGWVIWFSKDKVALETMDFWVGTFAIFVFATIQIIYFSWVLGVDRGLAEAHVGAKIRIPRCFRFVLKYVAPAYLLVVFVGFCVTELPAALAKVAEHPVMRWTLILIGGIIVLLVAMVWAGRKNFDTIAARGDEP